MAKFATFDADGAPTGFYSSDVHGPLSLPVYGPVPEASEDDPEPVAPQIGTEPNPAYPLGVVEITDDQWSDFLQNPQTRRWREGAVVAIEPPPPMPVPVSGDDILDALSPEQAAKADIRDLIRLRGVPDVAMLRSKLKRIAAANGIKPGDLIQVATTAG